MSVTRLWKVWIDWYASMGVMAEPYAEMDLPPWDSETERWGEVMDQLSEVCVRDGVEFIVAEGWVESLELDLPTRHDPPGPSGQDKYFDGNARGTWCNVQVPIGRHDWPGYLR